MTKKMKRVLSIAAAAVVCLLFVSVVAVAGDDVPVNVSQLPATAQNTLLTHFGSKEVVVATKDNDLFDKSYEVLFSDGDKVEFDGKGDWTEIKCRQGAVPAALVPQQIAAYVQDNYSGAAIVEIEKDSKEYEVKLSNGIELTFNKQFRLTEVDF